MKYKRKFPQGNIHLAKDINKLADFYNSLNEDVKEVTAVCVDACHVFAAGFYPMDAIKILESKGVSIKLIHYNNSREKFNSKKDAHGPIIPIGNTRFPSYIPLEELIKVGW